MSDITWPERFLLALAILSAVLAAMEGVASSGKARKVGVGEYYIDAARQTEEASK